MRDAPYLLATKCRSVSALKEITFYKQSKAINRLKTSEKS